MKGIRAYVMLTTKPGTSMEVLSYIKEVGSIEGVIQADPVFGRFDAIVVIEAPSLERLSEIIYKVIEKVPNVIHTETAIVLSGIKSEG
ncbi:MAG: Lrp/AsnC ligand binding domain-containing protein [Nitrososphaerota archaeon]|nr:Lrp/AsnC ligand binding domain-containing protein [Aigarchaeota archaeon]MDW8076117.1 Lrp/AsnC ligand binding domain-containing protein [Nitrososphaerota archaeon]